jgi:hypothetical protein
MERRKGGAVVSDRYKEMWEDAFHDNLEKKAEISELKAENDRLKAEVESLKRAGDLMLKYACANVTYPCYATMAKDWHAAKEGKQS